MEGYIVDDLPQRESLSTVWRGTISKAPTDEYASCMVTIDSFGDLQEHGPCRWGPRDSVGGLPAVGDICIVVFDEQNRPYVIGWWPV